MSAILEGIDASDLLRHLPSNVRSSLETLERAGTDWNAVGNLLAGTPTAGVAMRGTGQWTSELWEAVKWEFRSFLCTESERYAELRTNWDELKGQSSTAAAASLATVVGERLGVARGVVAPLVTWLLLVARRDGKDDACRALSATVTSSPIQPPSPFT